jgi:hypothetical protein
LPHAQQRALGRMRVAAAQNVRPRPWPRRRRQGRGSARLLRRTNERRTERVTTDTGGRSRSRTCPINASASKVGPSPRCRRVSRSRCLGTLGAPERSSPRSGGHAYHPGGDLLHGEVPSPVSTFVSSQDPARRSWRAMAACVKRRSQALVLSRPRAMSAAQGRVERLLCRRGPGPPR